jgi:hypothetical protein
MPSANRPQCEFLSMPNKYRAMVGGFGSSKTWTGCMAMASHHWQHPRVNAGYFAPTYPMIRDIFYPTMDEVASDFGLRTDVKEGNKEVHFYSGRQYRGTTICRSMENPNTIIGFKIGYALVDEFDMLEPRKAHNAWRKIIARMRYNDASLKNGVDVVTTPEGFRATHKLFVADLAEKPELAKNYGLLQVSTYDNEANLPADYIPSLFETYTKELVAAYIDGQFVNLTSGTTYRTFSRVRCNSIETIKEKEPLLVGMDFNVTKMAAAIFVQRSNGWHIVAELKDIFDTPDMVKIIKERWADKGHRIVVYPDASAKGRETVDASKSDISLLEQARFTVRSNPSNPSVKDRVNSVNAGFEKGRLWVNVKLCPTVVKCLEGQTYDDNGEPSKDGDFDHMNDALGYAYCYEHPVSHDRVVRVTVGGV